MFVYSSGKLVEEYSTKTPPPNPTTSYTATDQLGSPRVITNSLGEVVSRRDFLPFGEEITNNIGERAAALNLKYGVADRVRQKFTGYQRDEETGLDFAEARMYENRHGRFTAVDPLLTSGKSSNPQTFNRYVYVINSPLRFTDPSGLQLGGTIEEEPGTVHIWSPAYWIKKVYCYLGDCVTERYNTGGIPTIDGKDALDNYRNTEVENFINRKQRPDDQNFSNVILNTLSPGTPSRDFAPFGTEEQVRNLENAIETVDQSGIFSYLNNGYKYSTGRASAFDVASSGGLMVLNFLPSGKQAKGISKGVKEGGETFFRAMSEESAEIFMKTGKMPAGSETFISPTKSFASNYKGVLFEIQIAPGTTEQLLNVGVRDVAKANPFSSLPIVGKGWKPNNAFFKVEGDQVNIGLGNGRALDIFNSGIQTFKKIE